MGSYPPFLHSLQGVESVWIVLSQQKVLWYRDILHILRVTVYTQMKKQLNQLLKTLSLVFVLSSAALAQPLQKGLLWEISGKGLSKPSYLYGTMHVSSKLAFNLSDSFFTAIKNCDRVAV